MFASHYQVIERISRGGTGEVYRVFDTRMQREVAIKKLLPLDQTLLNEEIPHSLAREASTLSRFQHPNVVTIHSFERNGDSQYVVMELVDGVSLQEVIEEGALTVEDFKSLAFQLLDPLVAAQDLGILHRDLKPDNIMARWLPSGKTQFKILDFGIAKFSRKPRKQTVDCKGLFLGTVEYLAPEQLEYGKLDQRADLYSLGCVLYFALAQRSPFLGKSLGATIMNQRANQFSDIRDLRPDVPKAIAGWLRNLIRKEPKKRPENARAALAAFEIAVAGSHHPEARSIVNFEVDNADIPFPKAAETTSAHHTKPHVPGTEPVGDSKDRETAAAS